MFAPIDPRGGSPQIPAYVDGFGRGPTYSFLFPGAGQLARGNPQHQPGQWDPHGQLLQLLSGVHPSAPGSDIYIGGSGAGGNYQQPAPFEQHHAMVGAAQNLARFLAQQHTAGLRRYNGRH